MGRVYYVRMQSANLRVSGHPVATAEYPDTEGKFRCRMLRVKLSSLALAVVLVSTSAGTQTAASTTDSSADLKRVVQRLIEAGKSDATLSQFRGDLLTRSSQTNDRFSSSQSTLILPLPGITDNCKIVHDDHPSFRLGRDRSDFICAALFSEKSVRRKRIEWVTLVTQASGWNIDQTSYKLPDEIRVSLSNDSASPYFSIRPGFGTGTIQIEFHPGDR
jgi:hypothetical protein